MAIVGPDYKAVTAAIDRSERIGHQSVALARRGSSEGRRAVFFDNALADAVARGGILGATALLWVVLLVRIVGLRSFSKMTSFDFVMTVAMGSLVGSASRVTQVADFVQALAAMAALFAVQWIAAKLRRTSRRLDDAMQNKPMLLMLNGEIIEEALRETRVDRDELIAKLRESNVVAMSEVRAVVLETTGTVSVLQGEKLEPVLLEGVASVRKR